MRVIKKILIENFTAKKMLTSRQDFGNLRTILVLYDSSL